LQSSGGKLTDAEVLQALNTVLGKTDPNGAAYLIVLDAIRDLGKRLERAP
jgi:hypothetical protein